MRVVLGASCRSYSLRRASSESTSYASRTFWKRCSAPGASQSQAKSGSERPDLAHIRVQLLRQAQVRLPDGLLGGRARYAQGLGQAAIE